MNKKIIGILFVFMLLVVGCSVDLLNTPRKQVETLFTKYQTLDASVVDDLDNITLDDSNLTTAQREKYKNIMKRHYQNLTYKIKDEVIDGDRATVTAEVEVYNYAPILTAANTYLTNNPELFRNENGEFDMTKFNDYRLERLEEVDETITYTIELDLVRVNEHWQLNSLNDITQDKINGVYVY